MNIIEVIKSGNYLILDTETTGLNTDSEIVSIAIIDAQGNTLLDTLVKPVQPIPADATRVHGITNEQVANLERLPVQQIYKLLNGRDVVVYNANYDRRLLQQSSNALFTSPVQWDRTIQWYCAMKHFAEIYGDWNPKYKSYKWKTLSDACHYYRIPIEGAHGALADCLMTLKVCKAMAEAVR